MRISNNFEAHITFLSCDAKKQITNLQDEQAMSKKILITQSNYIPWKGYFDAINLVDEFVIYDEVQYTKRDWRNRNIIKTPQGTQWLSIPVQVKGNFFQKIKDTQISEANWGKKHWNTLKMNYSKAAFFKEFAPSFEEFYLNNTLQYLSEINYELIKIVCKILDIKTTITYSDTYPILQKGQNERLIDICKQAQANIYYTGASAKNYLKEELFAQENIQIIYLNYEGYPSYSQLYGEFVHQVSILDLIFNEGKQAHNFMKSFFNKANV